MASAGGPALEDGLKVVKDPELESLLGTFAKACKDIARALSTSLVTSVGTSNKFGDVQLTVDVIADKIMFAEAEKCGLVKAAASEEEPELKELVEGGRYVVCWDPLDGSSIVDCNWTVGTIIAIWKIGANGFEWKGKDSLIGVTGRQQVASMLAVYGPRATLLVTGNNIAPQEYTLQAADQWILSRPTTSIAPSGAKIFAPANLRANQDSVAYRKLIEYWLEKRYTLRYTGGLVPDVYQLFVKGQGVFCNPASDKAPAKLRLVFECAPIAFLIEAAGGKTTVGGEKSVLDVAIEKMEHRLPMCCGTAEEVDRFEAFLKAN
ncbi:unnamed protein product [Vitrella brassicaformis CCMP3155]|uniref:fructose-bisphosphatase n=1 Tax=Vitrella brassicaformis (strain CCMP3155) TaxID=1169540 RepID=A0A0G4ET65_VITBC|nr:unnamed protein product [Vitrella brassicaformis CCMP3155]|eukprot:CEM01484.1 unnamed protein product [Vitrella brassicaformis CCMP3155]